MGISDCCDSSRSVLQVCSGENKVFGGRGNSEVFFADFSLHFFVQNGTNGVFW